MYCTTVGACRGTSTAITYGLSVYIYYSRKCTEKAAILIVVVIAAALMVYSGPFYTSVFQVSHYVLLVYTIYACAFSSCACAITELRAHGASSRPDILLVLGGVTYAVRNKE